MAIPKTNSEKSLSSRTKKENPKTLPFWDDFSFANSSTPQDSLWQFGKSVWINNGMGINPPSLGVATFDGLDSLGNPYNVNDVLAKGFADKLISQPVQLNLVDVAQRPTVFISFYYQFKGRGEAPDTGDILRLLFKNKDGIWETVWSIENDGSLDPSLFYNAIVAVPTDNDRFFYDGFRFCFQNFARLSGPFDTWNIDYVYMNSGRSSVDISYPDRTLVTPLTSLFNEYYSIPLKHFFTDPSTMLVAPQFTMYNLRQDLEQPVNYYSYVQVKNITNGAAIDQSLTLDAGESAGSIKELQFKTVPVKTLPPLSVFDANSDTIQLEFKLALTTKDNVPVSSNGDYDITKYSPVDFRWNDTTRTHYFLSNYYAYDDGTAEYGAGLNQPGAQLMYKFDLKTNEPDNIVAVQIYFPRFGNETSKVIELQILKDIEGGLGSTLYSETVTVQQSEQDIFPEPYKLNRFVTVQGSFYVGWKQSTAAVIPVGLDKNTDSSDKMFFNINGIWEQNPSLKGSLMIRPIFGEGGTIVGVNEPALQINPYPNPNKGIFFFQKDAKDIRVFGSTGELVFFTEETLDNQKKIELQTKHPGLYLVQYSIGNKRVADKIIVQH